MEYISGFIAGLDHYYGLKIPYVEYRNDEVYGDGATGPDIPIDLISHFMAPAVSNH